MKYFRFNCITPDNTSLNNIMLNVSNYCGYLGRMYEFYFKPVRTDNVSTLSVSLVEKLPAIIPSGLFSIMPLYVVIDLNKFQGLAQDEKTMYILELCQEAIMLLVKKQNWITKPFEETFEIIKSKKGLFRDHWKKTVLSPGKKLKAQIYFEDDYEKNGTYVDFTDKKGNLIKRVQFTPRGYSVYCEDVGAIKWINDTEVMMYYIQTPRAGVDYAGNRRDYWCVNINGVAKFHYPRAEQETPDPHSFFNLGVLYWNGTIIMPDKEKGLILIRKAAGLKYKHAQKWLDRMEEKNEL